MEAMMGSELNLAGRKLAQVALTCRDLERSKAFYQGVLGLPFLFEASGMMFFQLDGLRLMVGRELKPDSPIGGSVVYFDAPDIDMLGPALEARGVKFFGPAQTVQRTETHELKLREFLDPDGNALALMGMVPIKSS
jgi:catechol 2,3-dioxygenase-like lactoylglutathione lyase family enzyme